MLRLDREHAWAGCLALGLALFAGCGAPEAEAPDDEDSTTSDSASTAAETGTAGTGDGDAGGDGDGESTGDGDGETTGDGDGDVPEGCFFGPLTAIGASQPLAGLAVVDLDANGYGDVVTDVIEAFLADEELSYTGPVTTLNTGAPPFGIEAALIDGDEYPDVVAGVFGEGFLFGRGDGAGGFELSMVAAPPASSAPMFNPKLADFDGDGAQDVLLRVDPTLTTPEDSSWIYLYRGDGTGGFSYEGSVALASGGVVLQVGDLNGDGFPDLVAEVEPMGVEVHLGNGSFVPDAGVVYDIGSSFGPAFVLGDVNGDENLDLVTNEIRVLLGDGQGGLMAPGPGARQSAGILPPFDIDGDGDVDLIGIQGAVFRVYRGDGAGVFEAACELTLDGDWFNFIRVGELDPDGRPDLVFHHPNFGLGYALGGAE